MIIKWGEGGPEKKEGERVLHDISILKIEAKTIKNEDNALGSVRPFVCLSVCLFV